ncbi:MAG: thiolase domain-containing protein, partial [Chloroflexota bacterium]|nr:thiolase domain-containing protein [Chloroflexota bacterium]
MRDVAIIGIGQTPVSEHWEASIRALALEAALKALQSANVDKVDAIYVGNMISGEVTGQEHLGALLADALAMDGVEAMKIEAACASGSAALRV